MVVMGVRVSAGGCGLCGSERGGVCFAGGGRRMGGGVDVWAWLSC